MAYRRSNSKRSQFSVMNSSAEKPRIKNPSEYQRLIFQAVNEAGQQVLDNFQTGNNQVVGLHIDALAGCGKTATTVEKDYYLPIHLVRDSVSVAFNSDIAKVLSERVMPGVESKTIHALGRAAIVRCYPRLNDFNKTDSRKYYKFVVAALGEERETLVARENLVEMIDRARDYLAWTAKDMERENLIERFDLETGHLTVNEFLMLAEKILNQGINNFDKMDFGDMIAMPVYHNLPFRKYSVVSVDEYQDLCPAQHELLNRCIKPGGLFFSVGDENQAIYRWRGADEDSINKGVARYNSKRYTLPRTYRCGKKIVESARKYVEELEAPDNAHEGNVIAEMPIDKIVDEVNIGDAILSRLNAPLLKLCFALIRVGIPANILGRDVADRLKFMIKRSGAKDVMSLLEWVEKWADAETEKRERLNKSVDGINDQAECMRTLCEGRYTIKEVTDAIDELFPDPKRMPERIVLLSTAHRAKGKEWERVFVLTNTFFLKKGHPQEEKNLAYVAETRAMKELILVQGRL